VAGSIGQPWIDTWAPSQWVTQPQIGQPQQAANTTGAPSGAGVNFLTNTGDGVNVSAAIGGVVLLALLGVFVLHQLGFRFVASAGMGGG
jgi:hypothetical protein